MNQQETAAAELEKWWSDLAAEQIERTIPKAVAYGSDDLRDLGAWLAAEMGIENPPDAHLVQLGITMYIRGKLARVVSAIKDGRDPARDSWFDLGVYPNMGLRALEAGAWPGVDLDALEAPGWNTEVMRKRQDQIGAEWRTCCHTIKGLDHLKGCKAVEGDQPLCTCSKIANGDKQVVQTSDPGCPTHGDAVWPKTEY